MGESRRRCALAYAEADYEGTRFVAQFVVVYTTNEASMDRTRSTVNLYKVTA